MEPGLLGPEEPPRTAQAPKLWMLQPDEIPVGLGLSRAASQRTVCKDNKKADTLNY